MTEGNIDFQDARDLINGLFLAKLKEDGPDIMGDEDLPIVYWDNLDPGIKPPADKPWFRVAVRHVDSGQSSLGEEGNRRFSRFGIASVQIFVPAGARGLTLADQLGKMTVDAFEGEDADGVWFRNVRLAEVGPDGQWFQYNVTANFTYDKTK